MLSKDGYCLLGNSFQTISQEKSNGHTSKVADHWVKLCRTDILIEKYLKIDRKIHPVLIQTNADAEQL